MIADAVGHLIVPSTSCAVSDADRDDSIGCEADPTRPGAHLISGPRPFAQADPVGRIELKVGSDFCGAGLENKEPGIGCEEPLLSRALKETNLLPYAARIKGDVRSC